VAFEHCEHVALALFRVAEGRFDALEFLAHHVSRRFPTTSDGGDKQFRFGGPSGHIAPDGSLQRLGS
jgi:hypothetical protein